MPLSAEEDGGAPKWVHLLPAGEIYTVDGRGPYRAVSMQAVLARSMAGDKLPIDECHSTDLAAPRGDPAPARGWVVALETREDGLWGEAEWTEEGEKLMRDKAYRGLSPAILHDAKKNVIAVLRASLTNTPNLKGLVALHSEEDPMDWKEKLIELLKLDSEADDEAVLSALLAKMESGGEGEPALQSEQSVLESAPYLALQAELTGATDKINALTEGASRKEAEAFVDGAIAAGHVGVKPSRDLYIDLHMEDPARAEKIIGATPKLKGETHLGDVPKETDESGLSESDRSVMALMGLSEDEYQESLKASGKQKETL